MYRLLPIIIGDPDALLTPLKERHGDATCPRMYGHESAELARHPAQSVSHS